MPAITEGLPISHYFLNISNRIGKLKVALKYLEDALGIEIKLDKTKALADTHLNICAVYSQLGKIFSETNLNLS